MDPGVPIPETTPHRARRPRLPREVWLLGFVSLFTDLSSEYIHSLLPVYLAVSLGASALTIGLVEGVAESLALFVKMFSGALSDWFGRRKPLVVAGYALSALVKPLFPLASGVAWVFGARMLDRLGKGIRGAPRDALIADVTPVEQRGAAYGLRQSLDTVGAFVGPSLAVVVLLFYSSDLRSALWFAVWPALVSVVLLVFFLRDPEPDRTPRERRAPFSRESLQGLGAPFVRIVAVGFLLAFARSAESFLVLRVSNFLEGPAWVPLGILVMSLAFTLTAYPAGLGSDRIGRRWFLVASLVTLCVADVVLASARGLFVALIGVALWGVHMGLGQGVVSAMVSAVAPARSRATAFGILHGSAAIGLLAASAVTGWLWDAHGASVAFRVHALIALLSAGATPLLLRARRVT